MYKETIHLSEVNNNQVMEGRERWKTEEQFINNRLTWLGFTQSLLFAAYGVSITASNPSSEINYLKCLIPITGLVTSALIFIGVIGATLAMYRLKRLYGFGDYFVSLYSTIMGWTCNIGIPAVFVCSWAFLIIGTSTCT